MSAPMTPLLVAPGNGTNLTGRTISSYELLRKLKRLNPRLCCPDARDGGHIEGWKGVTSLWLGDPSAGGVPICGVKLGLIPEWNIVDGKGMLVAKGWRAIFAKILLAKGASQDELERAFSVSLGLEGRDSSMCRVCIREGKRIPGNGGSQGMCDFHEEVYAAARRAKDRREELTEKARWAKEKVIVC